MRGVERHAQGCGIRRPLRAVSAADEKVRRRGHRSALEGAHAREATREGARASHVGAPDVVDFLVSQVEFEKEHAIEGGKEAGGVLSRWVTRALRRLAQAEDTARKKESQRRAVEEGRLWVDDRSGPPLRPRSVRLEVAKGGRELRALASCATD